MRTVITFALSNFTLTFLIFGLIAAAISLWRRREPLSTSLVVEDLFAYFLMFAIGFSFFYNFVFHVFFGDMAAQFIGWRQSPFQAEVGFASLGFSVVALLAFRSSLGVRAAAVVGPSCFLFGAAATHVYQMIAANNFAPGNAGVIFYTDIGLPAMGLALLWLQHRFEREAASPEGVPGGVVGTS